MPSSSASTPTLRLTRRTCSTPSKSRPTARPLLPVPGGDGLKRWFATSPTNVSLHNILVNGAGPQLALDQWHDGDRAGFRPGMALRRFGRKRCSTEAGWNSFKRGILFVAPDLFVLYDHLVAKEPVRFQMVAAPARRHASGYYLARSAIGLAQSRASNSARPRVGTRSAPGSGSTRRRIRSFRAR